MNARECSFVVLEHLAKRSASLDTIFEHQFSKTIMDKRDKRLTYEIVFGILRMRNYLDFLLVHFLEEKSLKFNEKLMNILRIGAYQILYCDRIPHHAAVDESVKLSKLDKGMIGYSALINGLLRKIIENKDRLPKIPRDMDVAERLSIQYSHPQWLISRWLRNFGLTNTKKLLSFNNERPDIFFRRKIKGVQRTIFEREILDVCDVSKGGRGYKGLYYPLKPGVLVEEERSFKDGLCTVQSESYGWAVALLSIKRGDKVLDVCAAPGGKTSLISDLTEDTGVVYACDLRFSRMQKVTQTIRRMQHTNVVSFVGDGTRLPLKAEFNKILIDAPCSATGVLNRNPDGRWMKEAADIESLCAIQAALLDSAAECVGLDGVIVYATCSLEPEENEEQIEQFLERHPEFIVQKPHDIKELYLTNDGHLFITPFAHGMDGMFAVRLKKPR